MIGIAKVGTFNNIELSYCKSQFTRYQLLVFCSQNQGCGAALFWRLRLLSYAGGSGSRQKAAPAPLKFAMVSAKMIIPVQTGISGIFSNTIKCKINLKTGTGTQFEKPKLTPFSR